MSDLHAPDKFEQTDWDTKPVVVTVLALFALLAIGLVVGRVTEQLAIATLERSRPDDSLVFHNEKTLPPAPRLQVDEAADLKEFRDREDRLLSAYEWTDRSRTAIRIPIDRAIDLTAEEEGRKR